MDVRMKTSRDSSPDLAKVPMQPRQKQMKKVQVVYYLSRGGQLEHPHSMEVVMPYNQELRLRDVMDRLTIVRGKGMPSLFSWSCKRSYKSGYVWNDLSMDDVICPVDGVEYVLKGSEFFQASPEKCTETRSSNTATNAKHATEGGPPMGVYFQDRKSAVPKRRIMIESAAGIPLEPVRGHHGLLPSKLPFSQNVSSSHTNVILREDDIGNISTRSEPPHYRHKVEEKSPKSSKSCTIVARKHKTFKSEYCMDSIVTHGCANADSRRCEKGIPTQEDEDEDEEVSTELSGGEESPHESSSFTSFTDQAHDESHQTKQSNIKKSVRFEEPNICQSFSKFSLLHFISCGSLAVDDDNILTINPLKPARLSGASLQGPVSVNSIYKNLSHHKVISRTHGGQLDCMAEDLRIANIQRAEKEYFSGSIVEMKTHAESDEEADPTLTKSASYNAERGSKSEMAGVIEKQGDHKDGGKSKCIPRLKCSIKESPRTPSRELLCDRNKRFS